jgi:Nickel responsive protein SCO4226-like
MTHPYIAGELARSRSEERIRAAATGRRARAARPRVRSRLTALLLGWVRARPGASVVDGTDADRQPSTGPSSRAQQHAMSLFIGVHTIDGPVSLDDVALAHPADLVAQGKHGVNYLCYWVDEEHGKIFCLVMAADADTAAIVHRKAHGLLADDIYPASEGS